MQQVGIIYAGWWYSAARYAEDLQKYRAASARATARDTIAKILRSTRHRVIYRVTIRLPPHGPLSRYQPAAFRDFFREVLTILILIKSCAAQYLMLFCYMLAYIIEYLHRQGQLERREYYACHKIRPSPASPSIPSPSYGRWAEYAFETHINSVLLFW